MPDMPTIATARAPLGLALLIFALFGAAAPGFGQVSLFAANEVRAAGMKDRFRNVQTTLRDGSEGARRHSAAITEAFKDADDWAPAAEDYYARKKDLIARAAALEGKLTSVIALNSPEGAQDVSAKLDDLGKTADILRSDYEFYMKLPGLAAGPQRRAAQAAMRLLGSTGNFPVSLAYFLDKTPHRPPFAPLPPGVMLIRAR
jgi:hypothetical protein